MKTRNAKKKAGEMSRTPAAKRKTSGKDTASGSSAKKKLKPAGKTSVKSPKKEKKTSLLKTTSKPLSDGKDLSAGSPQASKKPSEKKSLKSAKVKPKKVKEKTTKSKRLIKKTEKKASKSALEKAPSSSKLVSRRTTKKVIKKVKKAIMPRTRKTKGPDIEPSPAKKPVVVTKQETGFEKKNAPIPRREEVSGPESSASLPEEYGENELILIAVDPNMVFVDWEISPKEAQRAMDDFVMRVYDVTNREPLKLPKESFVDVKIKKRVGRAFFELGLPGRKVAIEIGVYENGKFLPVLRSWAVSMPRLLSIDELGIALELFESGIPVGY